MLTAFAEQALSTAEREGTLEQVSGCGDCREVIAVAVPPSGGLPTGLKSSAVRSDKFSVCRLEGKLSEKVHCG